MRAPLRRKYDGPRVIGRLPPGTTLHVYLPPPDCPGCGRRMRVKSTRRVYRWLRCCRCGETDKQPAVIITA